MHISHRTRSRTLALACALMLCVSASASATATEVTHTPGWKAPAASSVRSPSVIVAEPHSVAQVDRVTSAMAAPVVLRPASERPLSLVPMRPRGKPK